RELETPRHAGARSQPCLRPYAALSRTRAVRSRSSVHRPIRGGIVGRFQHLRGRIVRYILFDLGQTLWDSRTGAEQARHAANQRVVALLRRHFAPEALPTTDDDLVGRQFRETFYEYERAMARRDPH